MSIGRSASITLTVGGATPSTFGQAALLTINPGGDHLTIDPSIERLQITAGFMTFIGEMADPENDGFVIFGGKAAAFVAGILGNSAAPSLIFNSASNSQYIPLLVC